MRLNVHIGICGIQVIAIFSSVAQWKYTSELRYVKVAGAYALVEVLC